ncbi:electron transport complex subunit RsxG [Marinomonas transparens]|uniref:Ion-translocating oxidoreductase complex subunit G n=1 Tax=Marinomonas transparens TaxID=2795388 RepID=A0A934JNS0_9GAMM|nr:electron transport complex subunit RsxG [Marinomonas transparens]MBJ7537359.1 electron transport complex subunit RsxG [Marinomonas transparens]
MELFASIRRNSVGLGLFAVLTAGLIAITHLLTERTIQNNILDAQISAFNEILPADLYDNDLTKDTAMLAADPLLGSAEPIKIHLARKDGKVTGIIFETIAPRGYNGNLDMLVAVNKHGVVTGSRVISHKETPGLGDKVDLKKSNWILSFANKSLSNPGLKGWGVKKDGGDFDQFTGATITPRAVVRSVKNTLLYFEQHKDALLAR